MKSNQEMTEQIKAAKTLQSFYRHNIKSKMENHAFYADKLGLDLSPKIPSEAKSISQVQKEKFLALYDTPYKDFGRAQLDSLRYISYSELLEKLKECIQQYSAFIKATPSKKTALLVHEGHSQHWVASIALKYLPTKCIPDLSFFTNSKFFKDLNLPADVERVVMFDDWSISGTQAIQIYQEITKKYPCIEIVFIIPFITNRAQENLMSCKNMKLIIADRLLGQKEIPSVLNAANNCKIHPYHFHSGCAVYSAWATPDAMSSPDSYVIGRPSSVWLMKPEIRQLPSNAQLPSYPVISETQKPYAIPTGTKSRKYGLKI